MRVITGTARGKRLSELPGMDTRPTTDRVKEGLFNVIQFDIEGRKVLDLFAGTGQLGIECLSRGAAHCDFVDSSRVAAGIVRDNLRLTGLEAQATVHQRDFSAFLNSVRGNKYGLVFLDPPYAQTLLEDALNTTVFPLGAPEVTFTTPFVDAKAEPDLVKPLKHASNSTRLSEDVSDSTLYRSLML
jgi:16S rRNA (guanine(966)-N(2))-methyltransferase RsmD